MIERQRAFELTRLTNNIQTLAERQTNGLIAANEFTTYLDGLKGYRNQIVNFDFLVGLNPDIKFGDLLEGITFSWTQTDYAGFHATDPNWYEEGNYETGAMNPQLLGQFDRYFREQGLLESDQTLDPIMHYTQQPKGRHGISRDREVKRPDIVINVSGGERDDWGQFITCWLEDSLRPFRLNRNSNAVNALKQLARETGKQEISS